MHNDSKNKQARVETELQQSNFIVLINSESASKSNWVQKEIILGNENKIKIIDILVSKMKTESEINHSVLEAIREANKALELTPKAIRRFYLAYECAGRESSLN